MGAKFEDNAFKFYGSFLKCAKRRKKKKMSDFFRLISQKWLARFTSDLVCVLS